MHDILTSFIPVPGITAITISDDCITVARVERDKNDKPTLSCCVQRRFFGPYELKNMLNKLSKELGLKRARCTTLLPDDNYTLLLIDTPKVAQNELISALRWQVKDLIDRPVEETTFEIFPAPTAADVAAPESTYVFAADNEAIQQCVDQMTTAKINLHSIDTHEMALRNISMLLPEAEQGIAILWLNNINGTLIITRNNKIHLTRTISLGLDTLSDQMERDNNSDNLILEIQRSLDYYESRYQTSPIHQIILAPGITIAAPWLPAVIKQALDIDATEIDIGKHFNQSSDMSSILPADYFITIGAALRNETAAQ